MYFFDKKIEYLVWDMQEGSARGIGTVRFLVMDQICRIEIIITNCGKVQGRYPVYLLSGDIKSLVGEIVFAKGKGNLFIKETTDGLGHAKLPYQKVTGVYIDLKTEGSLGQKWLPVAENIVKKIEQEERITSVEEKQAVEMEEIKAEPVKQPTNESFKIHAVKWKQLCAIYPVVHPFKDNRAYLSIEPRDFVVMQERFHPMVDNSFLLHGYYHYRHLLLGRQKQGQVFAYYLGVPGVFYEKEKAAALFYGFEGFEGPVTPVREGDFGYYMKKVEI